MLLALWLHTVTQTPPAAAEWGLSAVQTIQAQLQQIENEINDLTGVLQSSSALETYNQQRYNLEQVRSLLDAATISILTMPFASHNQQPKRQGPLLSNLDQKPSTELPLFQTECSVLSRRHNDPLRKLLDFEPLYDTLDRHAGSGGV